MSHPPSGAAQPPGPPSTGPVYPPAAQPPQHGYDPAHAQPGGGYPPPGTTYPQPGYPPGAVHLGYPPNAYGGPPTAAPGRPNGTAAILLILGAIAGLLVGLLPWEVNGGRIGILTALDIFETGFGYSPTPSSGAFALAIIATAIGGAFSLGAGLSMFARSTHIGASAFALFATMLMVGSAVVLLVLADGFVFERQEIPALIMAVAWLPSLVGTIVGFAKR